MDSPGVGFFSAISGVSGAKGFATTKKGHISGIITNDANRTIELKLDHPEGDILYILALEFADVVQTGTPASDQSTHPIPATGPYMVQSYVPNRTITLVRNPNYNNQIPTEPSGNPDKVIAKIITDPVAAYQQVISGKSDYDFQPIPNDRLPEAQKKYKDQLRIYTNANTYYYALNNAIPPFNNIQARKAAQMAIDPQAIISGIYGGLGRPTENFLPPGYPQYKKIDAWHFDLAKAKQLVQQSGTAGQTVDVYGPNEDPSKSNTEYLAGQLTKIGYKTKIHLLSHAVYFQTIGNQATKAQAMLPGLPTSDRLVRRAAERQPDHADPQQQRRQREGPERGQRDRGAQADHQPHAAGECSLGEGRLRPDGQVRHHDPVHEPLVDGLLRPEDRHGLLCLQRGHVLGLRSELHEVRRLPEEGADRRRPPAGFSWRR